jgi:hypothetical protein
MLISDDVYQFASNLQVMFDESDETFWLKFQKEANEIKEKAKGMDVNDYFEALTIDGSAKKLM